MTTIANKDLRAAKPWYREPWPWLLMAGPFIVVVAGLTTAWLAVRSSDGLVAEDYYRQGLAAGQTVAKSQRAEELGITASVRMTHEALRVRLASMQPGLVPPEALLVTLSHPTRAGLDQKGRLEREGDAYAGKMQLPASGHWLIVIEDAAKTWRLVGSIVLPAANEAVIGGNMEAAAKPKL